MPRKLLIPALLLAAFAYGVAATEFHLFPYPTLKSVYGAIAGMFGGGETEAGGGVWNKARATGQEEMDAQTMAELANNPYLRGTKSAPEVESVTVYDEEVAQDGVNLVVSGHAPAAFLQDMKGNTLHEWRFDIDKIWPGPLQYREHEVHRTFWRRAHVFPNGDLLAIFEGIGMIKLDAQSNLIWANDQRAHHDLFIDGAGRIHTLARVERTEHEWFPLEGPFVEDHILVLGPDGVEQSRLSIFECFRNSDYGSWLSLVNKAGDPLHTNTLELMDGRFADRHPLYAKGNVLISVPTLGAIAVIDPAAEKVVWSLGGLWAFQHQPTVLDNGNILVFDNNGENGKSKAVEVDPITQKVVWAYRSTPDNEFWSHVLGSVQRLKNGNTLITESTTGRAFEVTPAGEIVWEFLNPNRAGDDNELIASLLEVVRIDRDYFSAEFAAAQNDYATGKRQFDLAELDALIEQLSR